MAAVAAIAARDVKGALALAVNLGRGSGRDHALWSRLIAAEALMAAKKPREALDRIEDAQRVVDSWPGHLARAKALIQVGEFAQAEGELRRCMTSQGQGAFMFGLDAPSVRIVSQLPYYLARALEGQGRPESKATYESFLTSRPNADHDPMADDARRRARAPSGR